MDTVFPQLVVPNHNVSSWSLDLDAEYAIQDIMGRVAEPTYHMLPRQ